ncbi:MAG TPA: M48 family metalloprotease [Parvibaculum sp.]
MQLGKFAALGLALCLAGCTTNPATGRSQLATIMSPEDEAQAGAEAHPKIVAAYGGVYNDERVGRYVAHVTARIAKGSDRPDISYRVTVLNSPVVNAFALPGGYVYVTRGLLALVDDEAELAGVLGHEIGHVIARHGAQRQTAALGASVLGAVLGAVVGNQAVDQVVGAGGQGLLAGYSRDQEYEADALGVRYLAKAGYDPYAQGDFLATMEEQRKLQALVTRQKYEETTDWLASHPATPERVAAAKTHAADTGIAPGMGDRNRNELMHAIDGIIYGDSPEQGLVRGRIFTHPVERIRFEAPPQFTIVNSPDAVLVQGPDKTLAKFDSGAKAPGVEIGAYLANVWATGIQLSPVVRFTINGMAAASATTKIGDYNARLVVIEAEPGRAYRFLMGTLPQTGSRYDRALQALVMSFRRLSVAEAAAAKPLRIRIVVARTGDTAATLGARMAYPDYRVERFRALNGLAVGEALRAGRLFKIVAE